MHKLHTILSRGSHRLIVFLAIVAAGFAAVGCSASPQTALPTPLPGDYIPTAVALTRAASLPTGVSQSGLPSPTKAGESTPTPETLASPTASGTPLPTPSSTPTCAGAACFTPTPTPTGPTAIPRKPTSTPTVTSTPGIPNAEIEIRNLGPLSRVRSPLHIFLYMKPGAGGKVLIELLGEDGRILYREIRKIDFVPLGAWATFTVDFEFEIAAIAESGRLKISVADEYGRTVALNSVPLILLSVGEADIVPPHDVLAPLIVRQPRRKALIQGGKLVVTGMARLEGDGPLMVKLVTAQGSEPGYRLADVVIPEGGGYGTFAIEVPYTVSEPTPALLIVQEGVPTLNDVIHLTSFEVLLSP